MPLSISIKRGEERRVLRGHPWIFSNEIKDMPGDIEPGSFVDILDHRGRFLGRGYFNPHSLIAIRVLTDKKEEIDQGFFIKRIGEADNLRKALMPEEKAYRMVFSEGDYLPGLIVDRYENAIVIQSLTAGIEKRLGLITEALRHLFHPEVIIARNDVAVRGLEGLKEEKRLIWGSIPSPIIIRKNGLLFEVDIWEGQKTGFFLDQGENYLRIADWARDREVLDCFCYAGGWALHAARAGAKKVLGVDISDRAIAQAERNATLNNLSGVCKFIMGDVFDKLREMEKEGISFGCIVLDPPAFAKSKKKLKEARAGYKEINLRAMKLLEKGGILISCSCSYHIDRDAFLDILIDAAADARKKTRLIEFRGQARDHPILLAARETEYLKCAIVEVC